MATGRIGTTPVLTTRWSKQPAAGTTSLSGLDDNSVSLVYSVGYEAVYRNGTLLSRGNDYTATNGTTITLVDATLTGDIIEVFANQTVPLTDTYSQTVANSLFVNQATFDAKGDLIAGTADNAYTKLSVGSNGDTLVADSSTSTGLRWQQPKTQNALYNSSFDIWQRGTSFNGSAPYYCADRWFFARPGAAAGSTVSRQSAGLTGFNYCARMQRDNGNTSTLGVRLFQSLETADSIYFAGKTVTLSFYVRSGANYSGGNGTYINLYSGTGTDQQLGNTGFTGVASIALSSPITPTSTWTRYSVTGTVSSSATEIGFEIGYNPTGTAGANDYIEVTGFQLEVGSVATPYSRQNVTLAGELAACQRYYQLVCDGNSQSLVNGCAYTSTSFYGVYNPRTQMRTSPTISATTGTNYYTVYGNNANDACDAITGISGVSPYNVYFYISSGLALTQGYAYWLEATSAATRVALQAEL
jgi:hypothetical protein